MKVLHICLACFFPDNYSYQENMLPKFHKELGYDVEVIASLASFDRNGKSTYLERGGSYINEYGIPVIRLNYKRPLKIYHILKRSVGLREALEKARADIIFIHGCQFMDMDIVVSYLERHPKISVYVDNHADFSNSGTNFFSKNILHKILWKKVAHDIEPYVKKFYGVLPARVDWLIDMYGLPSEKCELLVMGADDDKILEAERGNARQRIRERYGIQDDHFLIMTGGKIDIAKKQTLLLMKAVRDIDSERVRLIIFGSVIPEMQEQVADLCDGDKTKYIGWIPAGETYRYWSAADLAIFPGRHSVFWEQVAGMGIPMICKKWGGTMHIDVGGNVMFLTDDTVCEIKEAIQKLIDHPEEYTKMRQAAKGKGKKLFSYREIAKRAVEL